MSLVLISVFSVTRFTIFATVQSARALRSRLLALFTDSQYFWLAKHNAPSALSVNKSFNVCL